MVILLWKSIISVHLGEYGWWGQVWRSWADCRWWWQFVCFAYRTIQPSWSSSCVIFLHPSCKILSSSCTYRSSAFIAAFSFTSSHRWFISGGLAQLRLTKHRIWPGGWLISLSCVFSSRYIRQLCWDRWEFCRTFVNYFLFWPILPKAWQRSLSLSWLLRIFSSACTGKISCWNSKSSAFLAEQRLANTDQFAVA